MSSLRCPRPRIARAQRPIACLALVATGLWVAPTAHALEPPYDSPYLANPEMIALTSDATFYVSYDTDTMRADLAAGKRGLIRELRPYGRPARDRGKIGVYEPGILGRALRAASGAGEYAVDGNIRLQASGAIAFWLKPIDWSGSSNTTPFRLPGGNRMGIVRQARLVDRTGKVRRHERFSVYVRRNAGDSRGAAARSRIGKFVDGHWYLIVVNWAWPTVSMSINGGPFDTGKALTGVPAWKDTVASFYLGSRGGGPTLIDEVMVFSRPLDLAEAQLLHTTVRNWTQGNAQP